MSTEGILLFLGIAVAIGLIAYFGYAYAVQGKDSTDAAQSLSVSFKAAVTEFVNGITNQQANAAPVNMAVANSAAGSGAAIPTSAAISVQSSTGPNGLVQAVSDRLDARLGNFVPSSEQAFGANASSGANYAAAGVDSTMNRAFQGAGQSTGPTNIVWGARAIDTAGAGRGLGSYSLISSVDAAGHSENVVPPIPSAGQNPAQGTWSAGSALPQSGAQNVAMNDSAAQFGGQSGASAGASPLSDSVTVSGLFRNNWLSQYAQLHSG